MTFGVRPDHPSTFPITPDQASVKRDGRHFGDAGQLLRQDRGQNHLGNTDTNDETQGKDVAQLAGVGFVQCMRHCAHRYKRFDHNATGVLVETRLDVP